MRHSKWSRIWEEIAAWSIIALLSLFVLSMFGVLDGLVSYIF